MIWPITTAPSALPGLSILYWVASRSQHFFTKCCSGDLEPSDLGSKNGTSTRSWRYGKRGGRYTAQFGLLLSELANPVAIQDTDRPIRSTKHIGARQQRIALVPTRHTAWSAAFRLGVVGERVTRLRPKSQIAQAPMQRARQPRSRCSESGTFVRGRALT